MKISTSVKSLFLATLITLSSCATTKYGSDVAKNNYSNLLAGKKYTFKMRDGGATQNMIFSRISEGDIIGFTNKKDSTMVTIPKANVAEVKDVRKATTTVAGIAIGTAAAAALIFTSSRVDE